MWKVMFALLLFPIISSAQILHIESGSTITNSHISSPLNIIQHKDHIIGLSFYAQAGVGFIVSDPVSLEIGIRRLQYNVVLSYSKHAGEILTSHYWQSFWQVPVTLRADINLNKQFSLNPFGGVHLSIESDLWGTEGKYNGKEKDFGYEVGGGVSYRFGDNSFGLLYRFINPLKDANHLELEDKKIFTTSYSKMEVHTIGLSYRRDL